MVYYKKVIYHTKVIIKICPQQRRLGEESIVEQ
jgi:hypothetical protein